MPQLDSLTYFSQFFWFIIIFLGFYIIISNNIIPYIATVLKTRNKILKKDLLNIQSNKNIIDIETTILNSLKKS